MNREDSSSKKHYLAGLYDPEIHPVALRYMARAGLTNEQMAAELGISRRTLQTWKNDYEAVNHALTRGKDHIDNLVEEGLLSRALGMTYDEVKLKQVFPDPNALQPAGEQPADQPDAPVIERTVTKKKLAPDVVACIFWLKNRRPEQWRDVQEHKFSGKVKAARDRQKQKIRPVLRDPAALKNANELARFCARTRDAQAN